MGACSSLSSLLHTYFKEPSSASKLTDSKKSWGWRGHFRFHCESQGHVLEWSRLNTWMALKHGSSALFLIHLKHVIQRRSELGIHSFDLKLYCWMKISQRWMRNSTWTLWQLTSIWGYLVAVKVEEIVLVSPQFYTPFTQLASICPWDDRFPMSHPPLRKRRWVNVSQVDWTPYLEAPGLSFTIPISFVLNWGEEWTSHWHQMVHHISPGMAS